MKQKLIVGSCIIAPYAVFFGLTFAVAACPGPAKVAEPQIIWPLEGGKLTPDEEPDVLTETLDEVGQACRKLRNFGCPEGGRNKKGVPCMQWLGNSTDFVSPECINAPDVNDRAALRKCHIRCVN